MDTTAVETLRLRHAFHELERGTDGVPASYYEYIQSPTDGAWKAFTSDPRASEALADARAHVHKVELGADGDNSEHVIRAALTESDTAEHGNWVLIGGPPCQAYSLAGRSRRANDESFADDKKHFLYREYLRIIRTFMPAVFVMENVKGLLSSLSSGESMFNRIKADLENPKPGLSYRIHSLVIGGDDTSSLAPTDFIIRAERFGVPQKRHRVILLGIREGFLAPGVEVGTLRPSEKVTVADALAGLPKLRSGVRPVAKDTPEQWDAIRSGGQPLPRGVPTIRATELTKGGSSTRRVGLPNNDAFRAWVIDDRLPTVIQHEARGHMVDDLKRYRYAAIRALETGVSPKLKDFPSDLLPNHKNAAADTPPFGDRFRVQLPGDASTTVVSHIAKDGHYYIHPDPEQMRSLTVREAARLQSFPDNYFFEGTRTEQYHQVGNAVPPLLAFQIAEIVARIFEQWRGSSGSLPTYAE